jgi:hypothetical protein
MEIYQRRFRNAPSQTCSAISISEQAASTFGTREFSVRGMSMQFSWRKVWGLFVIELKSINLSAIKEINGDNGLILHD